MRVIFLVLTILVLASTSKNASASDILLNEIMANPVSGEKEWIEIYNSSSENINLNDWNLQERTSSGTFNNHALPNVTLQAKALCFHEFSTAKLNNGSDTVNLLDNTGALQDTYSYTSTAQGKTFARIPDGDNWNTDVIPTKTSICSSLTTPTAPPTTPTPIPSPTSSSSASQSSSSFTISNIPSQVSADQSLTTSVNLSLPEYPNTNFYLKGAFKKADSANYFGLTKVSENWVKNGSSYPNQFPITTDFTGNWSGNLEVKTDSDDSGFTGSDNYIFKVARYSSSGSGPIWSNEETIKINSTATNQGEPPTTTSTLPTNFPTPSSSSTAKQSSSSKPKASGSRVYRTASVAAATASTNLPSSSPKVEVKNQKQINPFIWMGLILIFAAISLIGYIYFVKKRHGENHF